MRLGLFVGADVGFGEDEPLQHAEQEARDLAHVFQEMGDLSRERTVVLQGPSAADLRDAMLQIEAQIREVEAHGDEAMLVFYYSGHASREGLHLGGTLLPMDALRRWLETSTARVRLAFVDACESGSLTRTRGGTPVDAIAITVDDALTMSGLAVVSSTGPLSVARESDSFGGGVFSRALLSGLRGGADDDGDGVVTLQEAYEHAFAETVIGTASSSASVQKPEFRYDLEGVGQVVLTRIPERAAGLILPEELEGIYTVVSVASGEVVARVDKQPGEARRLTLPTGRYVVRKVRREDVLLAELDLVWGGDRWIDDGQMSSVALGDPLARGGWTPRPLRIALRGTVATPFLAANPWTLGGEVELYARLRPTFSVALLAGHRTGARHEWSGHLRDHATSLGLGLVAERHMRRVDLSLGGGLEGLRMLQTVSYLAYGEEGAPPTWSEEVFRAVQWAPGAWAGGGLHQPVGPAVGLELTLRAALYRATVNDTPGFFLEGRGALGLSWAFGGPRLARAGRT
ncbi:MAG: caspase family protein [Pseudomonadota bacterium]